MKPVTGNHHLAIFGGHWSDASGDVKCLIFHVTSESHVTEGSSNFMNWSFSWYVTTLSSLVAICIEVAMFLVCHVIKQDHMIKDSGDCNNRRPLR